MNIKRVISGIAIVCVVGASTLGVGSGVADASPAQSNSGTAAVQPVGWHGGGHGYAHGWGHGYRDGWRGDPWWHRWSWPWGWHR